MCVEHRRALTVCVCVCAATMNEANVRLTFLVAKAHCFYAYVYTTHVEL